MKIMFLNTWNGKQDGFKDFILSQAKTIDVFCFQEVLSEVQNVLHEVLTDHIVILGYKEKSSGGHFSQATYVRNGIKIGSCSLVLDDDADIGLGIFTEVSDNVCSLNICNIHGRYFPGDKLDTPERIRQTKGILRFYDKIHEQKIIGGDFNLDPTTKSVSLFKEEGYRDLVEEENIPTTRNTIAWSKYPENPQYFADYVFVSKDVDIKRFVVPPVLISDHQPLVLEVGDGKGR